MDYWGNKFANGLCKSTIKVQKSGNIGTGEHRHSGIGGVKRRHKKNYALLVAGVSVWPKSAANKTMNDNVD